MEMEVETDPASDKGTCDAVVNMDHSDYVETESDFVKLFQCRFQGIRKGCVVIELTCLIPNNQLIEAAQGPELIGVLKRLLGRRSVIETLSEGQHIVRVRIVIKPGNSGCKYPGSEFTI